ncbi:helix-turn-helix domain-containing protein [Hymenobacter daecheongensis]|uniref:helix-turn-helix domain-containing protein n=1 Tax=Hymenobacter daecheongensis TaxID=496053 RepID=UPI0011614009|nr:helix-turn-helix domain-containing protein [Hymenobacter daecheongensis]
MITATSVANPLQGTGAFAATSGQASAPLDFVKSFSDTISSIIRDELERQQALKTEAQYIGQTDELLTVRGAALLLKMSGQTIHNWASKGLIDRHKLNGSRTTYFYKVELLSALKRQTRPDGTRKNARRRYQASL